MTCMAMGRRSGELHPPAGSWVQGHGARTAVVVELALQYRMS